MSVRYSSMRFVIAPLLVAFLFTPPLEAAETKFEMHHLPGVGRLRVKIPVLKRNPDLCQEVIGLIAPLGVEVKANPRTGSILVHYPPNTEKGEEVLASLEEWGYIDRGRLHNLADPPKGTLGKVANIAGTLLGEKLIAAALAQVGLTTPVKVLDTWHGTRFTAYTYHRTAGRLRVGIPKLYHNEWLARELPKLLEPPAVPGVTSVRANPTTGTVLIRFDVEQTSHEEILGHLEDFELYVASEAMSSAEYLRRRLERMGPDFAEASVKDALGDALEGAAATLVPK